jgi:hypothetical protein
MSLGQRLKLELDDGREIETAYDLRDIRAWEGQHKKSALVERMSYEQLAWLGHHAAVRRGELNGDMSTFEAFGDACVSVEGLPDQEPPDPTKPKARSRKASPKSPGDDSSSP